MAILSFFSQCKLIQLLRYNKAIATLGCALSRAASSLLSCGVAGFIVFWTFTMGAYLLFFEFCNLTRQFGIAWLHKSLLCSESLILHNLSASTERWLDHICWSISWSWSCFSWTCSFHCWTNTWPSSERTDLWSRSTSRSSTISSKPSKHQYSEYSELRLVMQYLNDW